MCKNLYSKTKKNQNKLKINMNKLSYFYLLHMMLDSLMLAFSCEQM